MEVLFADRQQYQFGRGYRFGDLVHIHLTGDRENRVAEPEKTAGEDARHFTDSDDDDRLFHTLSLNCLLTNHERRLL